MESTNIRSEIAYQGWDMDVTYDHKIIVRGNGEQREYTAPQPIKKVEQDHEYVHLTFEDNGFLQFKFEEGHFLVGDLFDVEGEHKGEFASHVFGEE